MFTVNLLAAPYFNNNVLSFVSRFFVPFDGAKVRRFFGPAMDFDALCAKTAPFVDLSQNNQGKRNL